MVGYLTVQEITQKQRGVMLVLYIAIFIALSVSLYLKLRAM